MKKIIILISCLLISTSFTACSMFNSTDDDIDVETSQTPSVSATPKVDDPVSEKSEVSEIPNADSLEMYANTMKETYGDDYIPDYKFSDEDITEKIKIDKDLYDDIWVEGSTMEENPDIFVAVKAKKGKEKDVEDALKKYIEDLKGNTMYKANLDKINAAEVYTNGEYVFLMLLGANEFTDAGDDMGENFKNEMKKAREALENMFK